MWQICGYIPTTLPKDPDTQVSLKAAQLSTSFVLETLIHSKEKVRNFFFQRERERGGGCQDIEFYVLHVLVNTYEF